MSLTTIRDLDYLIFITLPDRDLLNMRQTNKYFRDILSPNNSFFWLSRIKVLLGEEYILNRLPDNFTWCQWYFYWRKHPYDIISSELKLTPYQAYIRQSTEKGLVIGSENYQTINITLIKAFKSKDKNLIQYFFRLYQQIKDKSHDQQHQNINYGKIISSAIKQGYIAEARKLLDDFIIDHNTLEVWLGKKKVRNYIYIITKALGQSNLIDLMNHLKESITLKVSAIQFYCYGLIKGYYNDEAKKCIEEILLNEGTYREYFITEAYSYAYRSENETIKSYLQENHPDITFADEIIGEYTDEINKDDKLETIITLMKDCDEDLYFERFSEIIKYGRYDALKCLMSYLDSRHIDDWHFTITYAVTSSYKDILLFLLVRFIKERPNCFDETSLRSIFCYVSMAYSLETKYLYENIRKMKESEEFLSCDYYNLLVTSLKEAITP